MPTPSEKTVHALRRCCEDDAICAHALSGPCATLRAAMRDAQLRATELQFDLAEVDDAVERQTGVEEMNQKVMAFIREAGKLNAQMERVLSIAREIDEAGPRIAERLGVDP